MHATPKLGVTCRPQSCCLCSLPPLPVHSKSKCGNHLGAYAAPSSPSSVLVPVLTRGGSVGSTPTTTCSSRDRNISQQGPVGLQEAMPACGATGCPHAHLNRRALQRVLAQRAGGAHHQPAAVAGGQQAGGHQEQGRGHQEQGRGHQEQGSPVGCARGAVCGAGAGAEPSLPGGSPGVEASTVEAVRALHGAQRLSGAEVTVAAKQSRVHTAGLANPNPNPKRGAYRLHTDPAASQAQ
jgi:hypothetical protein